MHNIELDANKFFNGGNKAAGTRARKHLQELKQLAQDLRVLIQDTKNEKARAPPMTEAEHDLIMPQQELPEDQAGPLGY